jgi:ubiquitin-conjugating enzyme E2 Z
MSSNPWVNEPGFEEDEDDDEEGGHAHSKVSEAKAYSAKIHHETINITVLKRLEGYLGIPTPTARAQNRTAVVFGPPTSGDETTHEPFEDLLKRRFLWYYTAYHNSIAEAIKTSGVLVKDGVKMTLTPFESGCNGMSGTFNYTSLKERLEAVRDALNNETESWVQEGADLVERESPLALAAQNMFKNMPAKLRESSSTLDFELIDDNPFVWRLILFGQPMTNLDEGVFKIKIVFSTRFPEEQPRVTVETPIFHHLVSPDGILAYIAPNPADHKSHIEAIVEALVGNTPCPDCFMSPNPEAATLMWGTPEQRKLYARKLRRSAQQSSESVWKHCQVQVVLMQSQILTRA